MCCAPTTARRSQGKLGPGHLRELDNSLPGAAVITDATEYLIDHEFIRTVT